MSEDLSLRHDLVGNLFSLPASEADREKYLLSEDQIEFYRENGYLAGVRILTDRQVEGLRAELASILDESHPGMGLLHEYHGNESGDPENVLFHCLGHWRLTPGFHDLLWNPAFTTPASQLLGGPVRFWHDQLFCKPARHGGVVAWHQDYSYWTRTQPMNHLTCWIALDDSTKDNGCIQYIPKSHAWELLPITGLAGDMDSIQTVLSPERQAAFQPAAVELKKGEASFHHPLTVHGSHGNKTDRPRRACVINAVRDGVRSDVNEPLLQGVPVIPKGRELGGPFFPLLSEPEAG